MGLDLARNIIIRWDDPDPAHFSLLRKSGATAALIPRAAEALAQACVEAGIRTTFAEDLRQASLAKLDEIPTGEPVVLEEGLWPGVRRSDDGVVASATRKPWINANSYLVAYLRAHYPARPAVLGYLPNDKAGVPPDRLVPFDTLELALAEAWAAGGNYILAVDPRYREALLRGDPRALANWERLGRTARWLGENAALFGHAVMPDVTLLVEKGEGPAELANLLYRHGASPRLVAAGEVPPPGQPPVRVLSAVNLQPPRAEARRRILAHADAGATVVVDAAGQAAWWQAAGLELRRDDEDRAFYALGRGRIVAYKEEIIDPSAYASDIIDLVTPARRPVRMWGMYTGVIYGTAAAHAGPLAGAALMHILNYGRPLDRDAVAQIQGRFTRATLWRPDAPPLPLKPIRRKGVTEVTVPALERLGVIVFA